MSREQGLVGWVRARGYHMYDADRDCATPDKPSSPTHLLLNGGKYYVPDGEYEAFLDHYAADVTAGAGPHFLSEQRPRVFKMHADLDLKLPSRVPVASVLELCKLFQQAVRLFYASAPSDAALFRVLVAMAPQVPLPGGLFKVGIHFVWPNLWVDQHRALMLRETFVAKCNAAFPSDPAAENYVLPWERVIDEDVLTRNGLRMLYSHKAEVCEQCRDGTSCRACVRGRVDAKRPYLPVAVLAANGTIDDVATHLVRADKTVALRQSSLRYYPDMGVRARQESPGFVIYAGAPHYPPLGARERGEELDSRGGKRKRGAPPLVHKDADAPPSPPRPAAEERSFPEAKKFASSKDMVEVQSGAPEYRELLAFIRTSTHPMYRDVQGAKLVRAGNGTNYTFRVRGGGSHFCQNYGRDHHNAQVYFVVGWKNGVVQKCQCTCPPKEEGAVACSKYKSDPYALPENLQLRLFPLNRLAMLSPTAFQAVRRQIAKRASKSNEIYVDNNEGAAHAVRETLGLMARTFDLQAATRRARDRPQPPMLGAPRAPPPAFGGLPMAAQPHAPHREVQQVLPQPVPFPAPSAVLGDPADAMAREPGMARDFAAVHARADLRGAAVEPGAPEQCDVRRARKRDGPAAGADEPLSKRARTEQTQQARVEPAQHVQPVILRMDTERAEGEPALKRPRT